MTPLCFIIILFGGKPVGDAIVGFEGVCKTLRGNAVRDATLQSLRAIEERAGGVIHRQMYKRLVPCAYALADLFGANTIVFYEPGARPGGNLLLC